MEKIVGFVKKIRVVHLLSIKKAPTNYRHNMP